MKINREINAVCGIYRAAYRLTIHRDGGLTVKTPYIKWCGNTGTVEYRRYEIPAESAGEILEFFERGVACIMADEPRFLLDAVEKWQ